MSRNVRSFFAMAFATAFCPIAAFSAEWFVSPEGNDSADGKSEATAKLTIQKAIDAAAAGDTVTLLPGDYVEGLTTITNPNNPTSRSRVHINKRITLRSRDGRDVTRIVGAWDESATSPVGMGENAIRCIRMNSDSAGSRIEGITLYRGATLYNNNAGAEATEGGGVFANDTASGVFVDCAFVDCIATRGGGFFINQNNDTTKFQFVRCLFKRCRDTKFGAALRGGAAFDCVFDDCGQAADSTGSGVGEAANAPHVMSYSHAAINCTFVNNEAYGVDMGAATSGGVYNCLFVNNGSGGNSSIKSEKTARTGGNVVGGQIYENAEVYSPLDGDYRLIPGATAIGKADASNRSLVPEEFRTADYASAAVAATGAINAGAVQTVADKAPSGIAISRYVAGKWFFGDWEYDGEPVEVFYRTWRAVPAWPAPRHVKYTPKSGHLVRYALSNAPVWPLRDGSVYANSGKSGQVQTIGVVEATDAYWADPVNGSDDSGDGTESNPYRTLTKAVQASEATHVVYAKAGDYAEGTQTVCGHPTRVAVQNNLAGEIRVIAVDGPDSTFITGAADDTGDATYLTGPNAVRCIGIAATGANYVAFQGFTIRDGHTGGVNGSATGATTMGGAFANFNTDSGNAKLTSGYLLDCVVENSSGRRGGVMYGGTALRCVFRKCLSANTNGGGLFRECMVVSSLLTENGGQSELFAGGAVAVNVTTYGNTVSSVYNGSLGTAYARNSVLVGRVNAGWDITANSLLDNQVNHSVYSRMNNPSGTTQTGAVQENPARLVDAETGNYRLAEDSAGVSLAKASYMVSCMDIEGNPFEFASDGSYQAGCYAPRAATATLYVNPSAGSDSNDGSEDAPFATLAAAVATALSGDTVIALPGMYASGTAVPTLAQGGDTIAATIPARVVVKSGVTLESKGGPEVTFIVGAADPATGGCGEGAVRGVFLCKGATLRGFTVTGGYTAATSLADGKDSMTIDNVGGGVLGCYMGASASEDEYAELVEDCVISGNTALRGGGAMYGYYRNCRFVDNKLCADKPGWGVARAKLEGCYFSGNGDSANTDYGHSTVYGCTLVNCTVRGGQAFQSGAVINEGYYLEKPVVNTVIVANRISVKNLTNCVLGSSTQNRNASPVLENVAIGSASLDSDGVPQDGSSVIDAGDTSFCSAEYLSGRDLADVRRVLNSTIDIGAFEYDWGEPWGKALSGNRRLVVDDMPSDARLVDKTLVFGSSAIGESGVPVRMTWTSDSNGAPYTFAASVTGTGALTVTLNGENLATVTAASGLMQFSFNSELDANALSFFYDGPEADGVTLSAFSNRAPLVIVVR